MNIALALLPACGLCGTLLAAETESVSADSATGQEAQPEETLQPPAETASPAPVPNYFFPDLPAQTLVYDGKRFRLKPIIAIVTDYTGFTQDDDSLAQVGEQEDTFDLRAARIGVNLQSKSAYKWGFTFPTSCSWDVC